MHCWVFYQYSIVQKIRLKLFKDFKTNLQETPIYGSSYVVDQACSSSINPRILAKRYLFWKFMVKICNILMVTRKLFVILLLCIIIIIIIIIIIVIIIISVVLVISGNSSFIFVKQRLSYTEWFVWLLFNFKISSYKSEER